MNVLVKAIVLGATILSMDVCHADNAVFAGPGGITSAVDVLASMAPVLSTESSADALFYVIGGSFHSPDHDLPGKYLGMFRMEEGLFDPSCSGCHLGVTNASDCSPAALAEASYLSAKSDAEGTPLYVKFVFHTDSGGSISNPYWGQSEEATVEVENDGSIKLFGARDFKGNLDFSFHWLATSEIDMQSFTGGKAAVIYGQEGKPKYCGILQAVSQGKSDELEQTYFDEFGQACNALETSSDEYANYACNTLEAKTVMVPGENQASSTECRRYSIAFWASIFLQSFLLPLAL